MRLKLKGKDSQNIKSIVLKKKKSEQSKIPGVFAKFGGNGGTEEK